MHVRKTVSTRRRVRPCPLFVMLLVAISFVLPLAASLDASGRSTTHLTLQEQGRTPAQPKASTAPAEAAQRQSSPAPAVPAGNAQNGKQLFTRYGCFECHGHQAQGSAAGPRLGPRPLGLNALVKYIRQPTGQMPPYSAKVVSDAEVADIHAFLQSLPQPPAEAISPLLK
jgi:mono/diheme cytochrome c family protein